MTEIHNNIGFSTPSPYRANVWQPPPYRPPMSGRPRRMTSYRPNIMSPPPYRPPMNLNNVEMRLTTEDNVVDDENLNDIIRNLLWNFPENNTTKLDNLVLLNCVNKSECSICMEHDVSSSTGGSLKCKHTFHTNCLKKWFSHGSTTCPCCRASIDVDEYCRS